MSSLRLKSAFACGVAFFTASAANAAPLSFTTPHIATNAGPSSVTFGGQTFTNQGLVGVVRIPAGTKDFNGDTFGAFSSLDILPGTWHRNADGTYGGTLYALPDRGPNQIGSVGFSDYASRVNVFSMNLSPYTGAANLPASVESDHQLALTQTGGFFVKDFNGNVTTGLDPGTPGPNAYVTENGFNLPGSKVGAAAGKIAIDAEGLRFLRNGNFYISDEYGANVYYFDKTGNMLGVITPPTALVPRTNAAGTDPNTLSFNSLVDSPVGRRFNQGLEGLAVTPDQKHLVTLLQSATEQDSTSSQATRTNTRLMIYDITGTRTPTTPVADYVLQLPVYNNQGNGGAANATAAQSELLALNDTQFLVLSRDANGLGLSNNPFVYKSVLLVDTTGATNIAGTPFETSYTPIATNGVLNSALTPVAQTEVVNILNSTQLGKFGINLNNAVGQANRLTLTEKWEGMALVPALDEKAPQDYFLLIGNDDDFLATNCNVGGQNCAQGVNSDATILTYRVTLPTYVEPQFLQSMIDTTPGVMSMTLSASRDMAVSYDIGQHLEIVRHDNGVRPAQSGASVAVWGAGNWSTHDETSKTTSGSTTTATLGVDAQLTENLLLGTALGLAWGDNDAASGIGESKKALQISAYGAFQREGFFADLTGTYSDQRFRNIRRPGAYSLTALGNTVGTGWSVTGEGGYLMTLDDVWQVGPLAGFQAIGSDVQGYAETGAAGGNVQMPGIARQAVSGFFGGEASAFLGPVRGILRLTYNTDDGYDALNTTISLINAANAMGTQTVVLPGLGQAHIAPSITLTGTGDWTWWASYGANIGVDAGTEHHLSGGLRYRF
jgi:uncharacterized protein YhjY with autotransporter beta-barrel domain